MPSARALCTQGGCEGGIESNVALAKGGRGLHSGEEALLPSGG